MYLIILSPISSTTIENGYLCSNYDTAFLRNSKLVVSAKPRRSSASRRCGFRSPVEQKSYDHIPKQFRQENIKDGLMDNYKNTPQYLYGLTPSQMDMFMTEHSPVSRQAEKVTEIVPAVTELVLAQFMWLDYDSPTKPIYIYFNSSRTQDEKMETVGSETEAYAIADTMAYCKADVYTVNCGTAYGQAAMLLSIGAKGYRGLQPNSSTKLYLPKVSKSSGAVIDMWLKAKELDANTESYLSSFWPRGLESQKNLRRISNVQSISEHREAIDYEIADKIIDSEDVAFEKRNYDELLAQSKSMRRAAGIGPPASPSGFR